MHDAVRDLNSSADRGEANFLPASERAASRLVGNTPLYKTLISNFEGIAYLKSQRLPGRRQNLSFETSADLHEHFEFLRPDFAGAPLLCFAHAQLVVCIRRKIDLDQNVPAFLKLWAEEFEFLAAHLNSRWLISACDTFADYGSDAQKAGAMLLVVLINTVKLAETERLALLDPNPRREKFDAIAASHDAKVHIELWDGLVAYTPFAGDMPRNMLRRLATLTGKDRALNVIARILIHRAIAADTLLGRLGRLNNGFLSAEFA